MATKPPKFHPQTQRGEHTEPEISACTACTAHTAHTAHTTSDTHAMSAVDDKANEPTGPKETNPQTYRESVYAVRQLRDPSPRTLTNRKAWGEGHGTRRTTDGHPSWCTGTRALHAHSGHTQRPGHCHPQSER